jgi:hypothetical protein
VYTFDGRNSKSQNSTSALESLRLPSNNDDDDAPVSETADPRRTTTPIPFPVLAIVGLLALFWCASWDGGAFSRAGELCKFSSDLNRHPNIILHNAARRTHLRKVVGVHQEKISGLCWQMTTVWRGQKY